MEDVCGLGFEDYVGDNGDRVGLSALGFRVYGLAFQRISCYWEILVSDAGHYHVKLDANVTYPEFHS